MLILNYTWLRSVLGRGRASEISSCTLFWVAAEFWRSVRREVQCFNQRREERTISQDNTPWELLDELDRPGLLCGECGRLRAARYRHNQASAADLERVRVAAWDFLGTDSCSFESPEVLAVRAVICLLFPDDYAGGERWFDTVHFFLDASNRAANRQREQVELLRELFPEYLGKT